MRIVQHGQTITVTEIEQLAAANAAEFQASVSAALCLEVARIDIDLRETDLVDCRGVGALLQVRKCARQHNAATAIRLLNAGRSVRRLLQITRTGDLFDLHSSEPHASTTKRHALNR